MENEADASQQKMNSANPVEFANLSAESGHKCTVIPY